jgi:hypothetical protein
MENPPPPHRRLVWLTVVTLGTLLLFPGTRYLMQTQVGMEMLRSAPQPNLAAERAAAAQLPDDYPIQLALATQGLNFLTGATDPDASVDPMAKSKLRNRRVAALAQRFPENPSVYANLLRYMTLGEVRVERDETPVSSTATVRVTPVSAESLEMFEATAAKGAQLDPDNAYFPMMQSICLFDAHRDDEALEALKSAGRRSQWREYYQDEADGQVRLQTAAYGEQAALQRLTISANVLFPHYAQLRSAGRVAIRLAAEKELAGNTAEALAIRHAMMRCGGLMRSQGTSYITTLVGISLTNIALSTPGGVATPGLSTPVQENPDETKKHLEANRSAYYAYLTTLGQTQEVAWVKTEAAAGDEARALENEALKSSLFNGRNVFKLGLAWMANVALLSSVLVLLTLGAAAHLARSVRPNKSLWIWRSGFALLILGGLGMWQCQVIRAGMGPYVQVQALFFNMCGPDNSPSPARGPAQMVQSVLVCLGLLTPLLLLGLIGGIALFQRVPLATGLGRGLRGIAAPLAAGFFLLYGASLLPTAVVEADVRAQVATMLRNEPHGFAEATHRAWPGDPQP